MTTHGRRPDAGVDPVLILIARIWNGILGLVLLAWFVLFAFITLKMLAQGAWGFAIIAAVFAVFAGFGLVAKVAAILSCDTGATGLDAFITVLGIIGIRVKD